MLTPPLSQTPDHLNFFLILKIQTRTSIPIFPQSWGQAIASGVPPVPFRGGWAATTRDTGIGGWSVGFYRWVERLELGNKGDFCLGGHLYLHWGWALGWGVRRREGWFPIWACGGRLMGLSPGSPALPQLRVLPGG